MRSRGGQGTWQTSVDSLHQAKDQSFAILGEKKQTDQQMSVCRGTLPTTPSLTSSISDDCVEAIEGIQGQIFGQIFAVVENEEMAQQLAQDGDIDLFVEDKAALKSVLFVQDLGERGRREEGLSGGRAGP